MSCRIALAVTLAAAPGCKQSSSHETGGEFTVPASPATRNAASADQKVAFYQECWQAVARRDWPAVTGCYHPSAESTLVDGASGPLRGPSAIVERGPKAHLAAFSDTTLEPRLILQSGDRIASIVYLRGVHTGPLASPVGEVAATRRTVGFHAFHYVELAPDKLAIRREWHVVPMNTLLGQLGVRREPHRAVAEKPLFDPVEVVKASGSPTEKANLAAYQAIVRAFNRHDADTLRSHMTADFINTDGAAPADLDLDQAIADHVELFKSFPDIGWLPDETWAAGDYVLSMAAIKTVKGSRPVDVTAMEAVKFAGGKHIRTWIFYDGLSLARQQSAPLRPAPLRAGGE